ncbi:MAG TPA: oligosaccharide flippase family protein [Clostridia bacterium]|nr:oligosaccharide flippase family protein [Clostridia bacterium]
MVKRQSLFAQTAVLSGANFFVRILGFVMRIWLSRTLGAEAMGVMELASSAHMLWIAPVTSGLPMAVSRHTARAQASNDPLRMRQTLVAGRRLAAIISWIMLPVLLLLAPVIARLLGDARTLPALLFYIPCLPILGLSAVYNGYFYGAGNTLPPALSEFTEQVIRFGLCVAALTLLPQMRAAYAAAVPAAATAVGEGMGLLLVVVALRTVHAPEKVAMPKGLMKSLWRLSLPMTVMRVSNTLMRTVNAILIPARLRVSGLMAAEATARFGMIHGMAMPLVMLPAVVTGALAMVAAPAFAARENNPAAMRRLLIRVMVPTLLLSILAMGVIWFGAPLFAQRLYRQAELESLLRVLCPCVLLMGIQQVFGGILAGLGQQRRALYASLAGAIVTVVLNYFLAALPSLRLTGVAIAMQAGQVLTLAMNLRYLLLASSRAAQRAQEARSQQA